MLLVESSPRVGNLYSPTIGVGGRWNFLAFTSLWVPASFATQNLLNIPRGQGAFGAIGLCLRVFFDIRSGMEFDLGDGGRLSVTLFTDVTNSKELLQAMQEGKLEPEVALLNASLIPDVFPVLVAAQKSFLAKSRESLTTRTLHSELVYNYSGSKHITESLKRCGISDSTTYVFVARFGASPDEMKSFGKLINGKEIGLEELEGRADHSQIQKHYKISTAEMGISSLADAITCRIAARDAL